MAKNKENGPVIENEAEYSEEGALGFPAYLKIVAPEDGKPGSKFAAMVCGLDDSNPDFERWVFQAEHDVMCQRGPAEDAVPELVKKGDYFSTSAYGQFGDSSASRGLHSYVGHKVLLTCTGTKKMVDPKKAPMFVMKLNASPATMKAIRDAKNERMQNRIAGVINTPPKQIEANAG